MLVHFTAETNRGQARGDFLLLAAQGRLQSTFKFEPCSFRGLSGPILVTQGQL